MREDILGISWLPGKIRFASIRKGKAGGTWECEGRVDDLVDGTLDFAEIVKEAVKQTGFGGKKVAMVLEHSRLTQQLIETPPSEGRELELYVRRQIDELKIVDEEVVCSWQVTHPVKLSKGLILYLLPKSLQERFVTDCRQAGLQLVVLVSPTAVLSEQLTQLPLDGDQIALLAAETEGTTAVAVGRREGPVFLTRALRCGWQDSPERVAWQMSRSIAYVKQQYQADVASIWLYGENVQPHRAPISEGTALPVEASPVDFDPYYWTQQVVRLSPDADANLITREVRHAPKRAFFTRITAALLSLQVFLSVVVFAIVEIQVRSEIEGVGALQPRVAELEARKTKLSDKLSKLKGKKALIKLIGEDKAPAVPYWFLSYVADVIPDELLLTELQVGKPEKKSKRSKKKDLPADHWVVRLEGTNRPLPSARPGDAQEALASLIEKLENGPFGLNISDFTRQYSPRTARSTGWTVKGAASRSRDIFFVEGTIRTGVVQ